MTEVMFFFDTEDFTSNRSADAIKDLADICTNEGITGHFAIVGLLAKQLKEWDRNDVIASLKPHVIGTHTYGHSLHPNICELSDFEDFDIAYNNVAEYEDKGIEYINEVLKPESIMFACPPGNSKSYVAMYYYADKNIPFYCDTIIADDRNSSLFYCNQEHIAYICSLEQMFFSETKADVCELLNDLAENKDRVIFYAHPNMIVKTQFWDKLNYDKENLREYGNWIEAPDRAVEQTEEFYNDFSNLIRAIKKDNRFKIVNLNEILAGRQARTKITLDMISAIKEKLLENFNFIKEPSLSIADVFCAAVSFLRGKTEYEPEKVYGFLEKPIGIQNICSVKREDIVKASMEIDISKFLPSQITVGSYKIGPADFLFAALEVLTTDKEEINLYPRNQLNDVSFLKDLNQFKLKGTWTHSEKLEDNYLSDRVKLQCWTLRY